MKTPQEKRRFWHNTLSSPMNLLFGTTVGYFATINLWILLLVVPYAFQLAYAIIFKHEKK